MLVYKLSYYKVKWGDTLSSIAKRFNLDEFQIKRFNCIDNDLYVGRLLRIPIDEKQCTPLCNYLKEHKSLNYYLNRQSTKKRYYKMSM